MRCYRQLTKDTATPYKIAVLLDRIRAQLRPGDRLVFDLLVDPPVHSSERQLARMAGEPYRTFQLKKARVIAVAKTICK